MGLSPVAIASESSSPNRPDAAALEYFEAKVRPVLVEHCQSCHGADKQKGNLRLDSLAAILKGGDSGPAVAPGDASASLIIEAIGYEGAAQMPPKGKLGQAEIEAVTRWVSMGAPWPEEKAPTVAGSTGPAPAARDHWAFQPVRPVQVPDVKDEAWPTGPIDRFILNRLELKGLKPVGPADRRALIRRATFDLTGLPPTPAEVDEFLADDSPNAFARVVDRLLSSPRHGERWGRHWLDVARYGEDQAHTFEARLYPQGYMYRDWVVKALNDDMPYDRFVTEQIAADLVDGPDRDGRLAALGFFALGPVYYGKAIADERDDRVDTLTRGMLGLTVACARCHDHKFDPIPTSDYYALAGIFASTEYKEYPAAPKSVVEAYDKAQAEIKAKGAEADAFLLLSSFRGTFVVPKDKAESSLPEGPRKRYKALKSEAARLKKEAPARYPVIHALAEGEKPANLKVAVRGNPDNPGEEAPRRFLSILSGNESRPFTEGSGRRELAEAITRPDNPLTARVIVNRVWEHHFGRGIVSTPSNFGTLGEPPSHPELLDWLTDRFVSGGWSLKSLHRDVLLSATYQLASQSSPANQEADPDNVFLWRQNRRRLEVEAWRDAMLAVSGELEAKLGGPSQALVAPDNRRRTFYAAVSRHNLDGLLRLFDYPDPNITSDRRSVTTVPLQQLFVLNSEFMARQSKALAGRIAGLADTDEGRIRLAFPTVFGRPADEDEVAMGLAFLEAAGVPAASTDDGNGTGWRGKGGSPPSAWEQYAQVLLGSNEFLYVD